MEKTQFVQGRSDATPPGLKDQLD